MITLPVKKRRIFGADAKSRGILIALLIWLVVTLVTFFAFLATMQPVVFIIFCVCAISIIPISIVCIIKSKKYKGKNSFYTENVTFKVVDGILYAGDIAIPNIKYDSASNCICLNDTAEFEVMVRTASIKSEASRFIGFIEEPQIEDFKRFAAGNNLTIE